MEMIANSFGRKSELVLAIRQKKIVRQFFTAPYKILRPFHEGDFLQVMVVKVSAGMMAGDCQSFAIAVEDDTCVEILSQAYEKIHRMEQGEAVRTGEITVGRRAVLYFTPQPILPFAGSAFSSAMSIQLQDESSRLFYSDILACGRVARQERFQYRLFRSRVRIMKGEELIYFENMSLEPANKEHGDVAGFTQYEGYSHLGTFLLIGFPVPEADIRDALAGILQDNDCQAGVTRFAGNNLCIKMLAHGSELLVHVQKYLKEILRERAAHEQVG